MLYRLQVKQEDHHNFRHIQFYYDNSVQKGIIYQSSISFHILGIREQIHCFAHVDLYYIKKLKSAV